MDLRLLYAIVLSILPISELRGGLPLAMLYAKDNDIPIILVFLLIVSVNIFIIFFIFLFLDKFHGAFMNFKIYRKIFEKNLQRVQNKADSFEKKYKNYGFVALALFVGVPLPGTGVWTGCLISWFLGLDRKKSILSIALGALIAGVLVLLGTLGFIRFLDFIK